MAAGSWFEVNLVVCTTPELLAKARAVIEDSDLAEIDTWDQAELDEHRCRWDGSSPSTRSDEESVDTMDALRRGLHVHQQ